MALAHERTRTHPTAVSPLLRHVAANPLEAVVASPRPLSPPVPWSRMAGMRLVITRSALAHCTLTGEVGWEVTAATAAAARTLLVLPPGFTFVVLDQFH